MIMLSIILLISVFFVYININRYSEQLKTSYQMEVYFDNNLDSIECRDTFNKIYSMSFIEKGEYISKIDASNIFYKH